MTSSRPDPSHRLVRLIRTAGVILANALIFPLSRLLPRRRDLWLFGHQDGVFAGNPRGVFLWLQEHRRDIQAVWITGDPQVVALLHEHRLPVARKGSLRAKWMSLRAGAIFFSHGPGDVSLPLTGGALAVNLWHGIGLKSLRYGNPDGLVHRATDPRTRWPWRMILLGERVEPDLLVTTSAFTRDHFSAQFRMPPEHCPPLGYARVDAAGDPRVAARLARLPGCDPRALWEDGVEEVYAYLPTYRDSARNFLDDAFPSLAELEAVLQRRNAILYLKLHRHTARGKWVGTERIRPWPDGVDLDTSLPHLSGLITDYSSVHYDYIFHKATGSILYLFDEERYVATDRSLLYPLEENTAGWRVRSFAELSELIGSGKALDPNPDVPQVKAKFWGSEQALSAPRIVAEVERRLA